MDALEFLKELQRICVKQEFCKNCVAYPVCNGKLGKTDEELEEVVKNIEQWSKEHPKKTYKDVFLEVFPNAKDENNQFYCYDICVNHVFERDTSPCKGLNCEECWDREYKEDEE